WGNRLVYKSRIKFGFGGRNSEPRMIRAIRVIRGSVDLEHEADRALVCTRRHEVGPAESGEEVRECRFVGNVKNCELERHAESAVLSHEQIVRPEADVEQ